MKSTTTLLVSSIFVANNIIELIGQGSIGRALGQADSEVLERPLLDHKANYFKRVYFDFEQVITLKQA